MDNKKLWQGLNETMHSCKALYWNTNPIAVLFCDRDSADTSKLKATLQQYYFLVLRIAGFLSIGLARYAGKAPAIEAELIRNTGEEMGSRTNGEPHCSIFERLVNSQLGFSIEVHCENKATRAFLNQMEKGLIMESPEYAIGILLALETSATPELKVVGGLIENYAQCALGKAVVNVAALDSPERAAIASAKHANNFNLEDFIVLHTIDYESGHRDRLWSAICQDINLKNEPGQLAAGFQFLLNLMDQWWVELARGCA